MRSLARRSDKDELVRRLCARLDDAIGAPVVPIGCSSEHLGFPGTLSVGADTLGRWLHDLLASAARHGFETAFVFSAHGGNTEPLRALAPGLARELAPLRVLSFADLASVGALQRETSQATENANTATEKANTAMKTANTATEKADTATETAQKFEEASPDIQVEWAPGPTPHQSAPVQ